MKFNNTYIKLAPIFYQHVLPTPVAKPKLLLWNDSLAKQLLIPSTLTQDSALLAQYFSGNQLPPGAESIALTYSGHQFGHFNPQLGDGRAHLIGEISDENAQQRDIQLKGSGPTPFSRQGDGRCAIGPAVREYIMSEAMFALGVPTSRCLAVVASGEPVYRGDAKPGAIVTRVAASHIRVGTFQYFASQGNLEALDELTQYAIARHYPTIKSSGAERVITFLEQVIAKQITLITAWLRVGFIHGVMNTDNTAISGETIDFGPCAMMGVYHPGTVFSSIDRKGRYAFANQAPIAQWNMARLAEALLPLIDSDQDAAVAKVEPLIIAMSAQFQQAFNTMMAAKLGFEHTSDEVDALSTELLDLMQTHQLDYTLTFYHLGLIINSQATVALVAPLNDWVAKWQSALANVSISPCNAYELMQQNNPVVIPRNHHVEAVLAQYEQGAQSDIERFLSVLAHPYQHTQHTEQYQDPAADGDQHYRTFCGT
ncbi:hypothetical protein PULV_a2827 [Pseudoalteromonas ulvae UL12]|uniref:protein adenylyltransferase SelO n=1 Tax=Pseudoalteromonas ulvae TaxID=107327 RepID=UPI00186B8DBF|nr:YdiU family protein [Pseudoalteromonas ulvae]MBE0364481.1 hypothetical protein [Pseudoalteromonas ulvae UL12]